MGPLDMMFLGYNTNGLAHHELSQAVAVVADLGYRGVAITIDHHALSPYDDRCPEQLVRVGGQLRARRLRSVIETGARFLLDPWRKHQPTLLSDGPGRARRIEFYRHALRLAAELESDCVSLWSGALVEPISEDQALDRLADGLGPLLDEAERLGVTVALEPEPGMLVDTMVRFDAICRRLAGSKLRLTLDVGHLECQGEPPADEVIRRYAPQLANVHIEDMRRGVHEHLMFGEGQIRFPPIFAALAQTGYANGVYVELSRHSHEAPTAARRAYEFLHPWIERNPESSR